MRRALLFDLDDTLMVEESAAAAAFGAAADLASERCNIDQGRWRQVLALGHESCGTRRRPTTTA